MSLVAWVRIERMMYYAVVAVLICLALLGLFWDLLYGRDRRILRSREYCYRNLDIPSVNDEDFCNHKCFKEKGVPFDFVVKKRHDIADKYLDFPVDRLHPEMMWKDIPLDDSPWCRDYEGLYDEVRKLGGNPRVFFKEKNVAQIICDLYAMSSEEGNTQIN